MLRPPLTRLRHPYPAYKPSGVEWLGNVPAHWEMRRGKHLFQPIDVRSDTGDEELLTVSAQRGVVPRESANVTMFKAESYAGYKLCWPGDVVINSLWAWAHGLGVSQHHGIVSSAYGVYRPLQMTDAPPRRRATQRRRACRRGRDGVDELAGASTLIRRPPNAERLRTAENDVR